MPSNARHPEVAFNCDVPETLSGGTPIPASSILQLRICSLIDLPLFYDRSCRLCVIARHPPAYIPSFSRFRALHLQSNGNTRIVNHVFYLRTAANHMRSRKATNDREAVGYLDSGSRSLLSLFLCTKGSCNNWRLSRLMDIRSQSVMEYPFYFAIPIRV